jgi:hypothetical protein
MGGVPFRVLAASTCLAAGGGSTLAACPQSAADGFTMATSDGTTRMKVTSGGGRAVAVETTRGDVVNTIEYDQGLFPLKSTHPKGVTLYEYTVPHEGFQFRVGETLRYGVIARTPGQADVLQISDMRVVGTDAVEIGGCRFDVFVIEKTNRSSSDSLPASTVLAYFSEALKVPLRTRIRFSNGRQQDFIVSSITSP